jgi:hypothetical protein
MGGGLAESDAKRAVRELESRQRANRATHLGKALFSG